MAQVEDVRDRRSSPPRTGARIETVDRRGHEGADEAPGRPPHGGADRNVFERCLDASRTSLGYVAPRTGARIETISASFRWAAKWWVAPRTGARIETSGVASPARSRRVAPRTGARIETRSDRRSLSTTPTIVAPRTGARIETRSGPCARRALANTGRPPHGGADRNRVNSSLNSSRRATASPPARGRG